METAKKSWKPWKPWKPQRDHGNHKNHGNRKESMETMETTQISWKPWHRVCRVSKWVIKSRFKLSIIPRSKTKPSRGSKACSCQVTIVPKSWSWCRVCSSYHPLLDTLLWQAHIGLAPWTTHDSQPPHLQQGFWQNVSQQHWDVDSHSPLPGLARQLGSKEP